MRSETRSRKNSAIGNRGKKESESPMESVRRAVASARTAQKTWAALPFARRTELLLRVKDFVVANADAIVQTIARETGKPRMDALSTEVLAAAMAVNYYAVNAERVLRRIHLKSGNLLTFNKKSYVDRVPYGVVGIISPWNYPFGIPMHEVAMALMAGNGVILKVAGQTPEVGRTIKRAVESAGLPEGLFQLVELPGRIAGDAFLASGIDKLFFTGSVPVGKSLMAKAAGKLIPVSLELGGNDAMIVCADADLSRAVDGALWAGFSNSGQSCASVERVFVQTEVYDAFLDLLKRRLAALERNSDGSGENEIGLMTTAEQLAKVRSLLRDARRKGATVLSFHDGAKEKDSLFHPPVILTEVNPSMRAMQEEVFGPVVSVVRVANLEEAIAGANDSRYGLMASVWTKDGRKAHAIAARLEVGSVMINDHMMGHGLAETPWGGFKESGMGRTHGFLGLEAMTQPRVVTDDVLPGVRKNFWWYPYSEKLYGGLMGALQLLMGRGMTERIGGGVRAASVIFRMFSTGE